MLRKKEIWSVPLKNTIFKTKKIILEKGNMFDHQKKNTELHRKMLTC